ncbi:phosphomannomutase/phosphoglucomutase [Roseiflexus sp. RS-1]|uniref:phosphomannomutase/phosphoglucomutase n=1 Tax=Roseiflexus sp. (strain RS-1) TaxID=357808 RepID=UPI0000D82828|nr:phosphomannomutase/phosphoglucomutase [Roseiflexus sp. RS-1]ABQ92468.1 phosphomannomutase [Roseiflexus sp. RS-1]
MQIAPGIFKAYDIRGIYPTELNEEGAYAIGRAFVTFLQAREVIVGHDMRLSGPAIFDAVTRGIMDQGADVVNIGLVSTDQYYFACTRLGLPGMMVTASHNPKQYNGFKMVRQMPYLLSGAEGIQDLRRIVENDAYAPTTRTGSMRALDLSDEFVTFVLGLIDSDILERRRLKVIADTGNGTVGPILQRVYGRLPIDFIGMYLEPDGNLPNHGLDPLMPENRAELERRVVEEGADAGFAFDGDGDRFFVIDDRGRFISGDFLTALLGRYLLRRAPGSKIVYDVRASWAVRDLISAAGGVPLIERVGHAFIKRRMANENALFGGEVSGHYYFRDFNFADSGIIPSLLVMEMLAGSDQSLSAMLAPLEEKYFISGEINSTVASPKERLEALADAYADGVIEWIDGISVTYPTWHMNVRASNTEPLIRLNLEATTREEMERRRDEVLAILRG